MSMILDDEFTGVKIVRRDGRGRVALGRADAPRLYSMSRNRHGQILLTPVAQVPEHEVWLWNNPDALASVREGLTDVHAGRVHDMGSFAESADLDA